MGRNLLRRPIIILLLFLFIQSPLTLYAYNNFALKQSHREIKTWSIPVPQSSYYEYWLDYFSSPKGKAYLIRCIKRLDKYYQFIEKQLIENKMPHELLYLPLVESAFRNEAYSSSGAAGMWQFMMNSIEPYDIYVNSWRDDRRDFWRSTEAALDKLDYNYRKTGDWLLAIAAYNCGLGRVSRVVKESKISDYWLLTDKRLLPRETSQYIPKLIAVNSVLNQKALYKIPLSWSKPIEWKRIELEKPIDLEKLSKQISLSLSFINEAHSELNYKVTPPSGQKYYLKYPKNIEDEVQRALNNQSKLMEFRPYTIASGDTLSEIAQWYKISVNMIKDYNSHIKDRYLRVGQVILIPLIDSSIKDPRQTKSQSKALNWQGIYYIVKGDTLWDIAQNYKISPELLALKNNFTTRTVIKPGMKLRVPQ